MFLIMTDGLVTVPTCPSDTPLKLFTLALAVTEAFWELKTHLIYCFITELWLVSSALLCCSRFSFEKNSRKGMFASFQAPKR